ncbi:MAG: carboxypeptidase regulatory-like domain-containing protein [Prolixibacteraceae bacterium]|nr:carboxypeptidase regulatory-like domain-containing protein [Prolixibacteraceae bacterium]
MKTGFAKSILMISVLCFFYYLPSFSIDVKGIVIHEINQTPIANAGVLLVKNPKQYYHVKTSDDGTFVIKDVTPDKYKLHCDGKIGDIRDEIQLFAKTWYPNAKSESNATLLDINESVSGLTITLSGHYISGAFYDAITKQPIYHNVARLFNSEWNEIRSIQTMNEKYVFYDLPDGEYYFGYTDGEYSPTYYNRASSREMASLLNLDKQTLGLKEINLYLGSGFSISGKVTLQNGSPVANTFVALLPQPAMDWWNYFNRDGLTDESGNFTINGISPGQYYLVATGRVIVSEDNEQQLYPIVFYNNTTDPANAEKISINKNLSGYNFVLKKGYSISGRVFCVDDNKQVPIPNIFVYVLLADGTYVNMMLTDENGSYRFSSLNENEYLIFTHGTVDKNGQMVETYKRQYYNQADSIEAAMLINLNKDLSNINLLLNTLNYTPEDTTHPIIIGSVIESAMPEPRVFPNPFESQTNLIFSLKKSERITISIFQGDGKIIKGPESIFLQEGIHSYNIYSEKFKAGNYYLVASFENTPPIIQRICCVKQIQSFK